MKRSSFGSRALLWMFFNAWAGRGAGWASGPGCGLGVRGLGLGAGVAASRAFSVHR